MRKDSTVCVLALVEEPSGVYSGWRDDEDRLRKTLVKTDQSFFFRQ